MDISTVIKMCCPRCYKPRFSFENVVLKVMEVFGFFSQFMDRIYRFIIL